MMNRDDYVAVANAIRNAQGAFKDSRFYNADNDGSVEFGHVIGQLVKVFAADNPRFNAALFIEFCKLRDAGYEPE